MEFLIITVSGNANGVLALSPGLSTLRSSAEVGFNSHATATEDGRGASYPGVGCRRAGQPQRGCVTADVAAAKTRSGLVHFLLATQGRRAAPTLG